MNWEEKIAVVLVSVLTICLWVAVIAIADVLVDMISIYGFGAPTLRGGLILLTLLIVSTILSRVAYDWVKSLF